MFSSESSTRQRIRMKNQALFASKGKSKKIKCRLLQFLFSALRLKNNLQSKIYGLSEAWILWYTGCSADEPNLV